MALAAVGLLVHHAFFFYGHFASDDMTYAAMAYNLFHGEADWTHPFTFRIVHVAALGLMYWLFGVSDWASAIPGLICSMLIVYTMHRVLLDRPWWVLAFALVSYFGMSWNTFYSDKIMADIYVSAAAFGTVGTYYLFRRGEIRALPAGAAMAVLLFVAFNAKGSIILLVPVLAVLGFADLVRWRGMSLWLTLSIVGGGLLACYGLVCQLFFGNPLERFAVIKAHRYLNECSYDSLPLAYLIERLTTGYWHLLQDYNLLPHLAIALLTLGVLAYVRQLNRPVVWFPLTSLVVFLSINFMTISFDSYNPVCTDPRHIMLYTPILVACSALSLATVVRVLRINTRSWWFYLALAVGCLFLLRPAYEMSRYNLTLEYAQVEARFTDFYARLPGPAVVYGSRANVLLSPYFMRFTYRERGIVFRDIFDQGECSAEQLGDNSFLVQSWYMDWHSDKGPEQFDKFLRAHGYEKRPTDLGSYGLEVYKLECAAAE